MCVNLKEDVIVASEVSDYINTLNFSNESLEEKKNELANHNFSLSSCLKKIDEVHYVGLGNVIVDSNREQIERFIVNSNALIYCGSDKYRINPQYIKQARDNKKLSKAETIKNIFVWAYSNDILEALDII